LPGVDSLTPVHDKIRILHEADCNGTTVCLNFA